MLCIDGLEALSPASIRALCEVLTAGTFSISKEGIKTTLRARVALLSTISLPDGSHQQQTDCASTGIPAKLKDLIDIYIVVAAAKIKIIASRARNGSGIINIKLFFRCSKGLIQS